jgi:hypothetical protein
LHILVLISVGGEAKGETWLWALEWTTACVDRGWVTSQYHWCKIETSTRNHGWTAKASGKCTLNSLCNCLCSILQDSIYCFILKFG